MQLLHANGNITSMPSEDYAARSERVTPGGIHSQRRQTDPALCLTRAQGSKVWDAEGNQYIDFHNAYGCILLGHGDPRIAANVSAALERVDLVGLGVTPGEVELAERLVECVPCFDQVLLCNTGSEATLHAVRLARAVTKRERVLKFQGAYHGTHDYLLSNALAPSLRDGMPDPDPQAGVFREATAATLVCRYNDIDSVNRVVGDHGDEIAAIFVEPYAHNTGGAAPLPGFLEALREIATASGALLVFDEIITGIRHGLGGYQAVAGVTPDLTTLAKALGNGLPIAAIGGRREYMERFNTSPTGDVLYSGTFNGGGGPVAAARTVLDVMSEPGAYERLYELGERMRSGLREIFSSRGVDAWVSGFGSVFHLLFDARGPVVSQEDVARNDVPLYSEFRRQTMSRGILDTPETQGMRSYVSLGHSDEDIATALEAADAAIAAAVNRAPR
jgi:glutamate-1-semialdehyde 2,1-aminomutase